MLNRKIIILLMLVGGSNLLQAQLYIDGLISIEDQALLYANSDVVLPSNSSEVYYSGEISLSGDLSKQENAILNPSAEGERIVSFRSDDDNGIHHIEGSFINDNAFYNLVVEFNSENEIVDINSEIHIDNRLEMNSGILRTDIESQESDGNLYDYKVVINNSSIDALELSSPITESGPYIEGKLERRVSEGMYEFPIGISSSTSRKQPVVITTENGNDEYLTLYFQNGESSNIGTEVNCDLGEAPNYDQPDGSIDVVNIDCVFGQWVPESTSDFNHDIAIFPSSDLYALCDDAVIRYAGVGGMIEECPSFTTDNSVIRQNIDSFGGPYDIATASMTSITTSIVEIDGVLITTNVYPNPSLKGSKVYLDIPAEINDRLSYEIFNTLGQKVVRSSTLHPGANLLNTSKLNSGQYIVTIHIDHKTTSELIFIR